MHFEFPKTIWNITPWLWTKIASKTLKEFDMHQNIFMHHVNFDGYFLTVEIEKTCVMSYSNISLSEETSLNERCKLSHIVCFQFKIIFFRSSCTYSHRYIPTTPLSFFNLPFHSPSPSAYEFPFYFLRSHESIFWKSICAYVRQLNFSLHSQSILLTF